MSRTTFFRVRSVAQAIILVTALLTAGCITQQVREAIGEADLASLSAELGLGSENPAKPGGANWQQASAKIDAYITAHPENASTIAALRVRQAMMLLYNKQYHMAKAAFDEAKVTDLHTSRDRSLKELEEVLLWWYQTASGSLPAADYSDTTKRLALITKVRAQLTSPEDEGIRDWLAALRAWMSLKMANDADKDALGISNPKVYLEDGINTFASMLPKDESTHWRSDSKFPSNLTFETAINGSNRRRFRADALIQGAKEAIAKNHIAEALDIKDLYFRERISSTP